jgi:hypothetical protein
MPKAWLGNNKTEFYVSNFISLRMLRIHERVLFPLEKGIGVVVAHSVDLKLSRRLPPNLERLDVSFELELEILA